MKQEMNLYTETDQKVWKILFERQSQNLQNKACKEYLDALNRMKRVLNSKSIPEFENINDWFKDSTGWKIEVVKGLIPVDEFFKLLSEKKFCSSTWLRSPENLDYLEEPDMFHDVFGHIPLLADEVFSEFAHKFGILGNHFHEHKEIQLQLQRLYWFTIEFGLIQQDSLKIYGAGIISSFGETNRIFENKCEVIPFDLQMIFEKEFQTDVMQNEYFAIPSFHQLYDALVKWEKQKKHEFVF